jgi:hypothetical protein
MIRDHSMDRSSLISVASLLMILTFMSAPVYATTGLITCTAKLAGSNEVPPTGSPGTGTGTFTFDESTSTTTWTVTFASLEALATAAHIHAPAAPGINVAFVVPLTSLPFATSGSFSNSGTTLNGRTAAQFAGDLLAGNAYVNIHTSEFPGGEIRGQLSCTQTPRSVPEFGSIATILAISLVAVIVLKASTYRKPQGTIQP